MDKEEKMKPFDLGLAVLTFSTGIVSLAIYIHISDDMFLVWAMVMFVMSSVNAGRAAK